MPKVPQKRGSNQFRVDVYYRQKRGGKLHSVYLHRFLTGCPKGLQVDHINRDGLDNRDCNLRIVTVSENHRNTNRWGARPFPDPQPPEQAKSVIADHASRLIQESM